MQSLARLQTLLLAHNSIDSLSGLRDFQSQLNLVKLDVRGNAISDERELQYLRFVPKVPADQPRCHCASRLAAAHASDCIRQQQQCCAGS